MRRLTHNPFFFFALCLCAVLFCLMELWCIPFFAGLFVLLYAVIPYTAFQIKRSSALRKIGRICEKKHYTFAVKKVSRTERLLTIKTEKETLCITFFSIYRHANTVVTVTDEDHLLLQDSKSGTVAYATPAGGGYAMHGASVRKTQAFEFNPSARVVKNFPSRMKTTEVSLMPYANCCGEAAIRLLIVYPPACELFCKQKDESVLSAVGMRVGRTEVQTLTSFCEFLSAK